MSDMDFYPNYPLRSCRPWESHFICKPLFPILVKWSVVHALMAQFFTPLLVSPLPSNLVILSHSDLDSAMWIWLSPKEYSDSTSIHWQIYTFLPKGGKLLGLNAFFKHKITYQTHIKCPPVLSTVHNSEDSVISKQTYSHPLRCYSLLEWESAHHPTTEWGRRGTRKMKWWLSQKSISFRSKTQSSFYSAYAIPLIPPYLLSRIVAPVTAGIQIHPHDTKSFPHLSQYLISSNCSFWQLGESGYSAFLWLLMKLSISPYAYKHLAFPFAIFLLLSCLFLLTYRCSLSTLEINHSLVLCLTNNSHHL